MCYAMNFIFSSMNLFVALTTEKNQFLIYIKFINRMNI